MSSLHLNQEQKRAFRFGDYLTLITVILGILMIDALSKYFVSTYFYLGKAGFFDEAFILFDRWGVQCFIRYVANTGAAWGIGSHFQTQIVIARGVILLFLMKSLFSSSPVTQYRYALACIIAGGLGNLMDYFLYGHVVDMIHWIFWGYSYPVFNIADMAIVLGSIAILFSSLLGKKEHHGNS